MLKIITHAKISYCMLLIILVFPMSSFSQTKTNMTVFKNLVDSSASVISKAIPADRRNLSFNFVFGNEYDLFKDHFLTYFINKNYTILAQSNKDQKVLNIDYTIDNAKVKYGDIFRSGFLGSFKVPRIINFSGSYVINSNPSTGEKFNYTYTDTVNYGNIHDLENASYPVTNGNIPPEPFLGGLLEPVVAIGTAAVVIFLFFAIRSK